MCGVLALHTRQSIQGFFYAVPTRNKLFFIISKWNRIWRIIHDLENRSLSIPVSFFFFFKSVSIELWRSSLMNSALVEILWRNSLRYVGVKMRVKSDTLYSAHAIKIPGLISNQVLPARERRNERICNSSSDEWAKNSLDREWGKSSTPWSISLIFLSFAHEGVRMQQQQQQQLRMSSSSSIFYRNKLPGATNVVVTE